MSDRSAEQIRKHIKQRGFFAEAQVSGMFIKIHTLTGEGGADAVLIDSYRQSIQL